MNKKIVSTKDFDIVSWDWKEDCPWKLCAKMKKKYKYAYETSLDSDQNYVFFSDFKIKSDDAAEQLLMLDDQ